jgi:glycosyltransferase involved in cell wall biosynthesis
MQQVLETDAPTAREVARIRKRSPEVVGRESRSERLRVAVLAPPWFAVPPQRYGGTEAVVSLLADGLVAAGHEVTLFATGDSRTPGRLVSPFAEGRSDELGTTQPELLHALACIREAATYDVVSDHTGALGLTLSNLTSTPFLNTVHGTLAGEAGELYRRVCELTPDAALVSLTESHRASASDLPWAATIPNAIALDDHPCRPHSGGKYLFWLGRMSADKGPVTAIEVARAAGMPMLLAGKLRGPAEEAYFAQEVKPLLGGGIAYVGEIDPHERVRLLHGALALINPIAWEEPFGLVMVEAMACGAPVIAFPEGSAPELVIDGETGFVVDDEHAMAEAVGRLDEIDPARCRASMEERFDVAPVAEAYERAYDEVVSRSPSTTSSTDSRWSSPRAVAPVRDRAHRFSWPRGRS